MKAYIEKGALVNLRPNEQAAVDLLNGIQPKDNESTHVQFYEVKMGNTSDPNLNQEDVLITRWLTTCTGFCLKLRGKTPADNFVLSHIMEHPAEKLLKVFRNFRNGGAPVEKIVVSSQRQNVTSILAAIYWDRITNLSLQPKIVLVDRRTIYEAGGLLVTLEGGILLRGKLDLDELEPNSPKDRLLKYIPVKRWHW